MRISYKGDYALKAMLDLTLHYDAGVVTSHDMAKRIDAPIKFLEQVLLDLRKGGFIKSRRGNIGGYMLARTPESISVGEVVRHIDGPIEPIACLEEKYSNCADIKTCVFKKLWNKVYQATADIIDHVTFKELAVEIGARNQILAYSI